MSRDEKERERGGGGGGSAAEKQNVESSREAAGRWHWGCHPPIPSPTYPSHNPPPPACAATMMQATVSEVCAKGKEVLQ